MKKTISTLTLALAFFVPLTLAAERPLTPTERILREHQKPTVKLDVEEASANEIIENLLQQSRVQYTFIRSPEERLISLTMDADVHLALETVVFAAGFNIHRDGDYWVIHPLPSEG